MRAIWAYLAAFLAAALLTACPPVQVSPPAPPVVLLGACFEASIYRVKLVYQVRGPGYFWLRSVVGDTLPTHLLAYDSLVVYGAGESRVMWAQDLDDNHRYGVSAPGGHRGAEIPVAVCGP